MFGRTFGFWGFGCLPVNLPQDFEIQINEFQFKLFLNLSCQALISLPCEHFGTEIPTKQKEDNQSTFSEVINGLGLEEQHENEWFKTSCFVIVTDYWLLAFIFQDVFSYLYSGEEDKGVLCRLDSARRKILNVLLLNITHLALFYFSYLGAKYFLSHSTFYWGMLVTECDYKAKLTHIENRHDWEFWCHVYHPEWRGRII